MYIYTYIYASLHRAVQYLHDSRVWVNDDDCEPVAAAGQRGGQRGGRALQVELHQLQQTYNTERERVRVRETERERDREGERETGRVIYTYILYIQRRCKI